MENTVTDIYLENDFLYRITKNRTNRIIAYVLMLLIMAGLSMLFNSKIPIVSAVIGLSLGWVSGWFMMSVIRIIENMKEMRKNEGNTNTLWK